MAEPGELHYKGYSFDVEPRYEDDGTEWWAADVFQEVEGHPLYSDDDPEGAPRPDGDHRTKGAAVKAAKERVNMALARRATNPRACALPGELSTRSRDLLPAKAFGLPKERKYPMYRMARDGTLIPSGSHASNAKARAQQEYDKGRLTEEELEKIDRKADTVLKECGVKGKKRKKNAGVAWEVREWGSGPWLVKHDVEYTGWGIRNRTRFKTKEQALDFMRHYPTAELFKSGKKVRTKNAPMQGKKRKNNPGQESAAALTARLKF